MAFLQGDGGANALTGGIESDRIDGLGGNDTLDGGGGNDEIFGGQGKDRLIGGFGSDTIEDSDGGSTIFGDFGDDVVRLHAGVANEIHGGMGNDFVVLSGSASGKIIQGDLGRDIFSIHTVGTGPLSETFDSSFGATQVFSNGVTISSFESFEVFGSSFSDTLSGGGDTDFFHGSTGNDSLRGNAGGDALFGGLGNDRLLGGSGSDYLNGEAGLNRMFGEAGDDTILADLDITGTTADGGSGIDVLVAHHQSNSPMTFSAPASGASATLPNGVVFLNFEKYDITGATGNDTMAGGASNDTLNGGGGADRLHGNGGNDRLSASGSGTKYVHGGNGNDTINIDGDGFDTINGGAGEDWVTLGIGEVEGSSYLTVTSADVVAIASDGTRIVNCENFTIVTAYKTKIILQNGGDDSVNGSGGNDTISTGGGNDTITGFGGFDKLYGGSGNDIFWLLDGGNNLARGDAGNDTIVGLDKDDTVDAGTGIDLAQIYRESTKFTLVLNSTSATANDGTVFTGIERINASLSSENDRVTGGGFDDTIDGQAGDDTIRGGAGNDSLEGESGADIVSGDGGNDTINTIGYVDGAGDTLNGGDGNDVVKFSSEGDTANGGSGSDTVVLRYASGSGNHSFALSAGTIAFGASTLSSFERMDYRGGNGRDTVTGGALNDTIDGGNGADRLEGAGGNDQFYDFGGYEGDRYDGGSGTDTVLFDTFPVPQHVSVNLLNRAMADGAAKNDVYISIEKFELTREGDVFIGDQTGNRVDGLKGGDSISAGGGSDHITGGEGGDDLTGGAGVDRFTYQHFYEGGDFIRDFVSGTDRIEVNTLAFGSSAIIVRNGIGHQASGNGSQFLFDTNEHTLWFDADGAREGEAVFIAYLQGVNSMSKDDFIQFVGDPLPEV